MRLHHARLNLSRGSRSPRTSRPGDTCAQCGGTIGVYKTEVQGDLRVQYLRCRGCGLLPAANKRVIPLEYAPRRKSRT